MHEYHRFSSRNLGKIHKVFTECGKACGSRYKLSPELGLQYENIDIPAVLKETECQVKQFWLGSDVLDRGAWGMDGLRALSHSLGGPITDSTEPVLRGEEKEKGLYWPGPGP